MNNSELQHFYCIGRLGKTFGTDGALRLSLESGIDVDTFLVRDKFVFAAIDGFKVPFQIKSVSQEQSLIRFHRIRSDEQLKELVGKDLFVTQSESDQIRPSGKLLDGFVIVDSSVDEVIGRIMRVEEFPSHPMAFVQQDETADEIMIPLVDEWIQDIDVQQQILTMSLPEGLISLEEE